MRCIWELNGNWQCKCVTFFVSWVIWSSSWSFSASSRFFEWALRGKHVVKKKWSTSVLNATLPVTYNLIFNLWRLLRKAIENNWIHSISSKTGIILHFHQQPSDENLIIKAKWNGVKRRDWDHIPAEFPAVWLLGHLYWEFGDAATGPMKEKRELNWGFLVFGTMPLP